MPWTPGSIDPPDVVVGFVVVAVQDGGRQAEKLQLLSLGLVVIKGIELHGRFHQQVSLLVALHLTQGQHTADQQLPPILFGQNIGFA